MANAQLEEVVLSLIFFVLMIDQASKVRVGGARILDWHLKSVALKDSAITLTVTITGGVP
jgi:hypothetical protein